MKKMVPLITMALMFLSAGLAQAQTATTTIPPEHPSLLKGTRPLGMGNAFLAMPGTDENAMFYNPAAINDYEKKFHFRILSPAFDLSTGAIGLVKDVLDLANDIDDQATNSGKITTFRTFVNQHTGQFESFGVRLPVVQVMHKWFSVAILADSRSTISFRNRAFTNVEIMSRSDFGANLGGAYAFFDDSLQVGANVKILHRLSIDEVITTDDIVNNASFDDTLPRRRATGVGADLGLKYRLPTFNSAILEWINPSFGFTWQDLGNTRFSGVIPDTNQSVSTGFALRHAFGSDENPKKQWNLSWATDFRELNQSSTFPKKIYFGTELQFPQYWGFFRPAVRAGANQLYFTGGLTLDFKYAKLEFATYGEDAGKYTRQKQLRRIAGNLSFGF